MRRPVTAAWAWAWAWARSVSPGSIAAARGGRQRARALCQPWVRAALEATGVDPIVDRPGHRRVDGQEDAPVVPRPTQGRDAVHHQTPTAGH